MKTDYDYLIVGGGMVADAAARGIRELDAHGSIGILSADVDEPYTRPALTKKLWTDPDFGWDQVPLKTAQETGAAITLGTLVTGIDRDEHLVATEAGDTVGYGKLLLATGGRPNEIDAPHDDRIVVFRSARDYWRLRDQATDGTRVAVIGGGYIGAELAAALVQNGSKITLIHPEAVLGGGTFPADLADHYAGLFRDHGVVLRDESKVQRVEADSEGLLLVLEDSSAISADLVVVGLGVEPVTDLAEEAGLEVSDGVVVDEHLRTTDHRIWAAGDIALYPDAILGPVRVEHVDNAQSMGRAVGRAMAGDQAPYEHTPYFYSAVFGQRWEAVGQLDSSLETLEDWFEPLQRGVVYYLEGETPVGVLLWNVEGARDAARGVLAHPPTHRGELVGRIAG